MKGAEYAIPDMPLWHTNYFELSYLRNSQCKKDITTLLCPSEVK